MGAWDRFKGLFQRTVREVVVVENGESVLPELPLWRQFQRIGGSLTPVQVSQIIHEADQGRLWRFCDLFNESRQKDGHLQGILQTRENAVTALDWEIAPPHDANAAEKTAASDCTESLRASENFPDLIANQVGAAVFGHSTDETLWVYDGRYIVPSKFKHVQQRRFIFSMQEGKLLFNDMGSSAQGIDLLTEYPGQFIQRQPRINGDVQVREGLARVLLWAALQRNWSLRDWLQLGEIGWKPSRIATYKKGADKDEVGAQLAIKLRQLANTGIAVIPDTVTIAQEWPKATGTMNTSAHKELFDTVGAEMSKATLGQTLTTEQGARGSQSLGNVHNLVRADIMIRDAVGIASNFDRQLVRPFYSLNFGDGLRRGNFIFHTEDVVDLKEFSEAIKNFKDAGLRIPAVWIRNQGGIPEPTESEEVVGGTDPNADTKVGKPAKEAA